MSKRELPITEAMLALGCIGGFEMIMASSFWHQVMSNNDLILLRPGEFLAQLSVLCFLIGLVGGWAYVFRMIADFFRQERKTGWLSTILFILFIVEFFWVAHQYSEAQKGIIA